MRPAAALPAALLLLLVLGVACRESRPVVLATGQQYPSAVLVDGATVFWMTGGLLAGNPAPGRVAAVPLAGGETRILASGLGYRLLAQDREHLYWLQADPVHGTPQIARVSKRDGGPVTLVAAETRPVHAIAVDERHLYYLTDSEVLRLPREGGAPARTVTLATVTTGRLALAGDHVYFTDHAERVWSAPKEGGAATLLAAGQNKPLELAADDEKVYWINDDHELVAVPRKGGVPMVLVAAAPARLGGLAVAGGWVYTPNATQGTILRVHREGGAVRPIAAHQPGPHAIAAQGRVVVWADEGDGTVRRLRLRR